MLRKRLVSSGDFVTVLSADTEKTLLPSLATAHNITDFFAEYEEWQARIWEFGGFGLGGTVLFLVECRTSPSCWCSAL